MKILITTDCYTPMINGVVTSIRNLETQLRSRGHEVKILCPSQYLHGESRDNIVRIGSIGAGKFCNGARAAVCFRKSSLQKLIDWKPDVIHAQSEFFSFAMAKRIAAAVNCPIVHTYHTIYEDYTHYFSPSIALGRKAVVTMTRHVLQYAEAVIAPSRKVETLLRSYGVQKPIAVIPTGLDLQRFETRFPQLQVDTLKSVADCGQSCQGKESGGTARLFRATVSAGCSALHRWRRNVSGNFAAACSRKGNRRPGDFYRCGFTGQDSVVLSDRRYIPQCIAKRDPGLDLSGGAGKRIAAGMPKGCLPGRHCNRWLERRSVYIF